MKNKNPHPLDRPKDLKAAHAAFWASMKRKVVVKYAIDAAITAYLKATAKEAQGLPQDTLSAEAVEQIAQWLHDEVDYPDPDFPNHSWPEHPDDTGQRGDGWLKIVPKDVQEQFRDIAKRFVRSPFIRSLSEANAVLERSRDGYAKHDAARAAECDHLRSALSAATAEIERLKGALALRPTGCKDRDGKVICLGDKVRYRLEGEHTKREYWNPEYEVIFVAPSFTLKHIGGGKDAGSHDFILRCGGGNGDLEIIETALAASKAEAAEQRGNDLEGAHDERA